MSTSEEKAAEKRALAEKQAIAKKKAVIKETMEVYFSLPLAEKSPSPGSNTSLLNMKRISASLQHLLTLAFPPSKEVSNALLATLKAQTYELLEPLLLRERAYSSDDEEVDDKHSSSTPYFCSETTMTEFTIAQFREQEKILKTTFEAFWKSNHLGYFVSERWDFVSGAPNCTHMETLNDLQTCSHMLNRRIIEINTILKDWKESKKMLSRSDPEWEEEQRKLLALKEKLIFVKEQVDGLIEHSLFRFLYPASQKILSAEANCFMASLQRKAEEKREAEIVNEIPKKNKAVPILFEFPKLPEPKEINTSHPKISFWIQIFLFVIAFIASIFLVLELTTELLALSKITSVAIPILISITALSLIMGIISACASSRRNNREPDDDEKNIVKALRTPTKPHWIEPFSEIPPSFSQHTPKEKEKESNHHNNDLNDSNAVSEKSLAFF